MSRSGEQGNQFIPMTISLLVGGAISVLMSLVLLLVSSIALSGGFLSQNNGFQITIIVCLISAFAGGQYAKQGWSKKKLFAGLLTGVVFFLILATVGVLGYAALDITGNDIGILVSCICGGGIAGLLGGSKRRKKTRKGNR